MRTSSPILMNASRARRPAKPVVENARSRVGELSTKQQRRMFTAAAGSPCRAGVRQ